MSLLLLILQLLLPSALSSVPGTDVYVDTAAQFTTLLCHDQTPTGHDSPTGYDAPTGKLYLMSNSSYSQIRPVDCDSLTSNLTPGDWIFLVDPLGRSIKRWWRFMSCSDLARRQPLCRVKEAGVYVTSRQDEMVLVDGEVRKGGGHVGDVVVRECLIQQNDIPVASISDTIVLVAVNAGNFSYQVDEDDHWTYAIDNVGDLSVAVFNVHFQGFKKDEEAEGIMVKFKDSNLKTGYSSDLFLEREDLSYLTSLCYTKEHTGCESIIVPVSFNNTQVAQELFLCDSKITHLCEMEAPPTTSSRLYSTARKTEREVTPGVFLSSGDVWLYVFLPLLIVVTLVGAALAVCAKARLAPAVTSYYSEPTTTTANDLPLEDPGVTVQPRESIQLDTWFRGGSLSTPLS